MARITKDELEARITKAVENHQAFPYLEVHCPYALAKLDELIRAGQETHGPMDWQDLRISGNIEHAGLHIAKFFAGDMSEDVNHLLHFVCRGLMALELYEMAKEAIDVPPVGK